MKLEMNVQTVKTQDKLYSAIDGLNKSTHEWTLKAARMETMWICADCSCSFPDGMPDKCEWGHQRCTAIIQRDKRDAYLQAKPTAEGGNLMKDQHEKIKGYRDLSQEEIDLMNEGKALAEKCGEYIAKLEANAGTDKRNIALGKTNLQQGFMWAIRGVAQPTTF